jgi:putative tryptophan/tyrosine transport system substrate-binding protein
MRFGKTAPRKHRKFGRLAVAATYAIALVVAAALTGWSTEATAAKKITVAIANFMQHPALDAALKGMKDTLNAEGFVEGTNIEYVERNASSQIQLTASIANDLVARKPSVIVAVTTPMAQAVLKVAKPAGIPVVFTSVTDPVGAGIVQSVEVGEPNVTGASDAWPFEPQLKLIREITPNVKRLGLLFNPGEAASQFGLREVRKYAPELGFTVVEGPVNSTSDVFPVARGLIGRVDALFLSSDNTVISGMAGALKVAIENKIPFFVGESGSVQKGGLAAASLGYYALGQNTGRLVARFLRGERTIPTVVEKGTEIFINARAAELMGVQIPESVLKKAAKVFQTIE